MYALYMVTKWESAYLLLTVIARYCRASRVVSLGNDIIVKRMLHIGFYDVQKSKNLQHKKPTLLSSSAYCKLCLNALCVHRTWGGESSTAHLRPKNLFHDQKTAIFGHLFHENVKF